MKTINVLFHKVPFVRLAVFFALGCLALVKGLNFKLVYVILITGALFLLLHYLISKQKDESQYSFRWFYGLSVSAFMFAFGMIFSFHTRGMAHNSESKYYIGCVKSSPSVASGAVRCTVALSEVDDAKLKKGKKSFDAVVYIQKSKSSERIALGDTLMLAPRTPVVLEKNDELGCDEPSSNTLFVRDDAWMLVSKSNSLHAESIRDSLISSLKKKDVQMLN
ncbi:MAG: hypothetical protein II623_10180 [Paludibacteraceae bacterium]|nr:hypothetical protein [Paludibacteraceae bacterium]MBR6043447.1 hypothetical protein [Paludibacteraceae bacterium]